MGLRYVLQIMARKAASHMRKAGERGKNRETGFECLCPAKPVRLEPECVLHGNLIILLFSFQMASYDNEADRAFDRSGWRPKDPRSSFFHSPPVRGRSRRAGYGSVASTMIGRSRRRRRRSRPQVRNGRGQHAYVPDPRR